MPSVEEITQDQPSSSDPHTLITEGVADILTARQGQTNLESIRSIAASLPSEEAVSSDNAAVISVASGFMALWFQTTRAMFSMGYGPKELQGFMTRAYLLEQLGKFSKRAA